MKKKNLPKIAIAKIRTILSAIALMTIWTISLFSKLIFDRKVQIVLNGLMIVKCFSELCKLKLGSIFFVWKTFIASPHLNCFLWRPNGKYWLSFLSWFVSLVFFTYVSSYNCVFLSLCLSVPLSLCPSVPLSLCISVSLCHIWYLSLKT